MKLRLENLLTKIYFGAILIALPVVSFAAQEVRENKSARFSETLSETGAQSTNKSNSTLAEMIREQRAKLDNQETAAIATASGIQNVNACDTDLRKCMQEKCGNDFSKCFTDSESIWGGKMDACRRNTKCTSHEYALLVPEIKADRDLNVQMGEYQKIVKCGQEYNECIFKNCGTTMDNCIAKTDGDAAISKCKSIADKCKSQDSGLPSRATEVFATLRKHAQEQARADEKRLYELRDKMESVCKAQGAIFDNRTLDCVFTVNFYADNADKPYASKKLYSGSVFQCTPEWFGIDVTTFKENAYRLTRSEKAASSAALGAGVGTGVSTLTSGALERAGAFDKENWNFGKLGGENNDDANNSEACEKNQTWDETTKACVNASNNEQKAGTKMTEAEKAACEGSAGTPHINPVTGNEICKCPRETHNISGDYKTCIKIDDQPSDNGTSESDNNTATPTTNGATTPPTDNNGDSNSNTSDNNNESTNTTADATSNLIFGVLDVEKSKTDSTSQSLNGKTTRMRDWGTPSNKGDWLVQFDGYIIKGVSACVDNLGASPSSRKPVKNENIEAAATTGQHCVCKMTTYSVDDQDTTIKSPWIYLYSDENNALCSKDCALNCEQAGTNKLVRKAMYNNATKAN